MKTKVVYILLFTLFAVRVFAAPAIKVVSFEDAPFDQTANSPKTERIDQNNERCALIKVETTEKGFNFNVGILGVWEVDENHVGEIWVYVPHSVNHITIQHPKYGTLRNYIIPIGIEQARTYIMKLEVVDDSPQAKNKGPQQQFVSFQIVPKEALLVFNGSPLAVDEDGIADKMMPFGEYQYYVSAPDYHPEGGVITVNSVEKKVQVNVQLKPAFGALNISGADVQNAIVYIDNQRV